MLDNTPYALISTKLQRPRVGRDLVQRPRLLEQLADPAALTLVIAPAGYGKTTLLSAWLSLDAQDSDLITFATYLVAAVQTLFPTAGTETVELLNGVMRPPLAALIRSLLNTFESIEQEFILVLDDYHVIHDNAVHELITELVRYAPRSLYLVVAARFDPSLPRSSLRARGQSALYGRGSHSPLARQPAAAPGRSGHRAPAHPHRGLEPSAG
jgi:LuxR family maltose regulon positive regulatory protein